MDMASWRRVRLDVNARVDVVDLDEVAGAGGDFGREFEGGESAGLRGEASTEDGGGEGESYFSGRQHDGGRITPREKLSTSHFWWFGTGSRRRRLMNRGDRGISC